MPLATVLMQPHLTREVENFVRRMHDVTTANERIAKALLAHVAAQRSRTFNPEPEHLIEDRAR